MLETILFVYCLLFINTFYLSKLDVSRNNILLNSQNNDTTISSRKGLMNIAPAGNQQESTFTLVGSSETGCQLPGIKDYNTFWNLFAIRSCHATRAIRYELHNTQEVFRRPGSFLITCSAADRKNKNICFSLSCIFFRNSVIKRV